MAKLTKYWAITTCVTNCGYEAHPVSYIERATAREAREVALVCELYDTDDLDYEDVKAGSVDCGDGLLFEFDKATEITKDEYDTFKRVKARFGNLTDADDYVSFKWYVSDVIHHADSRGIVLTKEQAESILESCKNQHNAQIGMNYDVLDVHIDFLIERSDVGVDS